MVIASGLGAQLGLGEESSYNAPVVVSRFLEFNSEGLDADVGVIESRGLGTGRFLRSDREKRYVKGAGGQVELTAEEATCLRAAGIATVIVASGPGGYGLMARQQAEAGLAAGLRLEAYTFLEFESDPEWWVREALARLEGLPVARWWLDVEDTEHGRSWTPQQRITYAQRALDAFTAAGVFAHIYSGGWFWRPYMADTDAFARQGRQLWNSWYDGDPDVDGLPYGGWTAADVAIEQFEGTSNVCGQSVDKNWLYFTEEGEDMDLRARVERLERLIGGNGVDDEEGKRLVGEEALAWMDGRGFSLLLGLAQTQSATGELGMAGKHEHVASVEVRLT